MKDCKDGSVILIIGFKYFSDVTTLLKDYENGYLTEHFRPVQDAIRRIPGYEDYVFRIDITLDDYLYFLKELGNLSHLFVCFSITFCLTFKVCLLDKIPE